ncbi:MAG: helical backbone metal receptor [Owenweeksia sp.]|nr:helical backbone metal receptor [Owenweeksia sp.]
MATYRDQTGREVSLDKPPKRIISLVPSQTELLYDLGLAEEVVGITVWCVHPTHWLNEKTVIGGTKDLQLKKIRELQPDLIIGNKEENQKEQILDLAEDIPVWLSDIHTVKDAIAMIKEVGKITDTTQKSSVICENIHHELNRLNPDKNPLKTAYFIWKDPYMIAGRDTFIQSMLNQAGFTNLHLDLPGRYPQVKLTQLTQNPPQVIFLSSEPYAFTAGDMHHIANALPPCQVKIIDGEMLSWYGSRLVKGLKYLQGLKKDLNLIFSEGLAYN